MHPEIYGGDTNCPWTTSTLAVQAKCARPSKKQHKNVDISEEESSGF